MHRTLELSDSARRALNALSLEDQADFDRISAMFEYFLERLVETGYARRATRYGCDGYDYWDGRFPCQMFVQLKVDEQTETEHLRVLTMSRSEPDQPTQARV